MSNDDLKRLITQYEQWQSTGVYNFDDNDVIEALRELLTVRNAVFEINDIIATQILISE